MRRSCFKIFLLILLFSAGSLSNARGKPWSFGPVRVKGDHLVFNFKAGNLVDEQILRGLRRGMTAAIEYQVQLWKKNNRWMDELVSESLVRLKVTYDNWEKKYLVLLGKNRPHWLAEESVRDRCSNLTDFPAGRLEDLRDGSQYYIKIRVLLRPMSIENYQEIKQWLTGEMKDIDSKSIAKSKSPGKKAGNWFLGLVLNLTGFGDRTVTAKGSRFSWQNSEVVIEDKRP